MNNIYIFCQSNSVADFLTCMIFNSTTDETLPDGSRDLQAPFHCMLFQKRPGGSAMPASQIFVSIEPSFDVMWRPTVCFLARVAQIVHGHVHFFHNPLLQALSRSDTDVGFLHRRTSGHGNKSGYKDVVQNEQID